MEMMKVPESALDGHAFHTYQLVSADGTVSFEFQHNVVGRTTYAEVSTVPAQCSVPAHNVPAKCTSTM